MQFNLAQVHEAVSAAIPDRVALITATRTLTYQELTDESRRFASALIGRGFGQVRERAALAGHESGQDHLAIYLHNGPEYVVGMLGAFKARVAPLNVNYRYVANELLYLLDNSESKVVLFHDAFAPVLAQVRDRLPRLTLLIQVPDGSGHELLPGAVRYQDFLAEGSAEPLDIAWSPDDLYILYTGGTTGMPKGVLWRQNDIFISSMGGRAFGAAQPHESVEVIVEAAKAGGLKLMILAPLMHGAAQWSMFISFSMGNTVVFSPDPLALDPAAVLRTAVSEQVVSLQIVGDAMGRPIIDEIERGDYDLSGLFMLGSGGASLHPSLKTRFLELVPHAMVLDAVGSSESGVQLAHTSTKGAVSTGSFTAAPETVVISADRSAVLEPGSAEQGWLARDGHVPLGYLGDPVKTAATFPTIGGIRYSTPGDRALINADGIIELLGRESVTINSGGEKIFAEEVESALRGHPSVYDVVVVGRPSDRWGSEVVAIVRLAQDAQVTDAELLAEAERHLARYKLPKAILYRDDLHRSPAGKADYAWAAAEATAS
jgi:acyl-CoA synthetase (AMP-forming)/AMP-acid ligase II